MKISTYQFLSAFYRNDDIVCLRVFADVKAEQPDFMGAKFTEKLCNLDSLIPALNEHNKIRRGVFFGVNAGGHSDSEITKITAQFVEMDDVSIAEQQAKIDAFPLPPSIIVKTKKSLHIYWLMKDATVDYFRHIQLMLVKHFGGDPVIVNESRVMRLPGFYHCKNEPIMVECLKFEPSLIYTQSQLAEHLPNVDVKNINISQRTSIEGVVTGSGQRVIDKCSFIRYCKDNAKNLPEPFWHCMISNLSLADDGPEFVKMLSQPYPSFNEKETTEKILKAIETKKPHSCAYIKDRLGFKGCTDCKVKAPIVHCIISMAEQVAEFVGSDILDNDIFSDKTMELMNYAKRNMPAEYGKFKLKIKGKVSIRDFENAVKHKDIKKDNLIVEDTDMPLQLKNIDLKNAVCPANWDITIEKGVRKIMSTKDGTSIVTACPSALVISRRFENIDDKSEKMELSFFRNNRWKQVVASRSTALNRASLISYGDMGLPVSSSTSGEIVNFLFDYENANTNNIMFTKSISRLGWFNKKEFFPYKTSEEVYFDSNIKEIGDMYKNLESQGDYNTWKESVSQMKQNYIARFLLSASFASTLIERLNHRVFFVHIWHDSKSGKTAAIKTAISVWGNPNKLMGSFNATGVGLERMAGMLKNLPFAIDELQVLNQKRMPLETIVYGLSHGFGRLRGAKDGGMQDTVSWRNIVLTSGEQPMSKENSNDGIITRVLEIYGKPVEELEFAGDLHLLSEQNYGFAGETYIKYITSIFDNDDKRPKTDFTKMQHELKEKCGRQNHIDNVSVVCLGDYYSSMSVFGDSEEKAWTNAVVMGILILENNRQLEKADTISRSWDFVVGWLVANKARFENTVTPCFGAKVEDEYHIIPSYLREALEEQGFDYGKVTRGFKERGYFSTRIDKNGYLNMQFTKRVNGDPCKVFVVKLEKLPDDIKALV